MSKGKELKQAVEDLLAFTRAERINTEIIKMTQVYLEEMDGMSGIKTAFTVSTAMQLMRFLSIAEAILDKEVCHA